VARPRHQEFLHFLNHTEIAGPAGKLITCNPQHYAVHKHPKLRAWLARHPRCMFHFTPTCCSWANAVETSLPGLPAANFNAASFARLELSVEE
jgi:hypothetical protein